MLRTPSIVVAALQPLPLPVGGLVLQPLTVGHVLLLDRLGIDVLAAGGTTATSSVSEPLFIALFILSRPQAETCAVLAQGESTFNAAVVESCRLTTGIDQATLALLVRIHCQAALAPFTKLTPPPMPGLDSQFESLGGDSNEGNGLGWVLNLATGYQSRAHCWDWRQLLDLPIATAAVANVGARVCENWQWSGEPSYQTRDRLDAEEKLAASGKVKQARQGDTEANPDQAPAGNQPAQTDQANPAKNQHGAVHAG